MVRWLPEHPLVLASRSLARLRLIETVGIDVEAVDSAIEEREVEGRLEGVIPVDLAVELAKSKALSVSARYGLSWVLGCDQVLEHRGVVVHKAADRREMVQKLERFAGSDHSLHSAFALVLGGRVRATMSSTSVIVCRTLSGAQIEAYVAANLHTGILQSVGSYHFEAEGIALIERVEGEKSAVMGLPVLQLVKTLQVMKLVDLENG